MNHACSTLHPPSGYLAVGRETDPSPAETFFFFTFAPLPLVSQRQRQQQQQSLDGVGSRVSVIHQQHGIGLPGIVGAALAVNDPEFVHGHVSTSTRWVR